MRRLRRLLAGSLVAAVLASGLGCGKKEEIIVGGGGHSVEENHYPRVIGITVNGRYFEGINSYTTINLDGSQTREWVSIRCNVSDEDGDVLSYVYSLYRKNESDEVGDLIGASFNPDRTNRSKKVYDDEDGEFTYVTPPLNSMEERDITLNIVAQDDRRGFANGWVSVFFR